MAFLTPLALLGALLAIPIILLYMLRLRRREVVVSSTLLWQQILRDSEANTPWQRLRRNLLLILQLLILAFLVLALARPYITVPAVSAGQIELLIDASASMNATDLPGGRARFEEAIQQALGIIGTLGADDTMTIIRVTGVPEVIVPRTADQTVLRAAVQSIRPSSAEADWVAALTLAAADAAGTEDFDLVIISDGGLGDAENLPGVPGTIRYIPIGQSSSNLAITALATRALPGQPSQLFAQVTNYGTEDAPVIFDLRVDGDLFTAERYTIPAGQSLPLISEALPESFRVIQAGLTTPTGSAIPDHLALDNTAWALSSAVAERQALLMTSGNIFLEQVLRSLPSVAAFKGDINRPLPANPYDLYIFDSWLPADGRLPDGDLLIINPPNSTALFAVGPESDQTSAVTVRRDDPRTRFVDFSAVNILRFRVISGTPWATELIRASGGPLLLAGEVDGRQVAILTFAVHNSDLPLQITWPILMSNLLEWFTPRAILTGTPSLQVGQSLAFRPPFEATAARFTLPDGTRRDIPIERETVVFADTGAPGVYRVDLLNGAETLQSETFVVNLFSPSESDIAPRQSIRLSGEVISAAARDEVGQQEFWPWAALLALLILLIEWIVYWRRMHVRTVFRPIPNPPRVRGLARSLK